MALINFPLSLSLYLSLKVWSQPASGADKAGGLSSLWREEVAFIHVCRWVPSKTSALTHKDVPAEQESTSF